MIEHLLPFLYYRSIFQLFFFVKFIGKVPLE